MTPSPDVGHSDSDPMAVLFSYDPATGESTADPLVGMHPDGLNPVDWAYALKQSIEDDFPGRIWAVSGNEPARDLMKAQRMAAMGLGNA